MDPLTFNGSQEGSKTKTLYYIFWWLTFEKWYKYTVFSLAILSLEAQLNRYPIIYVTGHDEVESGLKMAVLDAILYSFWFSLTGFDMDSEGSGTVDVVQRKNLRSG